MTSRALLVRRVKENAAHSTRTIKSVMDWTVLVYFVIPALVISIAIYRSWWIEVPSWIGLFSFPLLFAVFFLFLWGGHFKTYTREADRVFLLKHKRLLLGMKRGGILISYLYDLFTAAYLAVFILPLWILGYHLQVGELLLFFGLWVSLKWVVKAVNGKIDVQQQSWKTVIMKVPLLIGAACAWFVSYFAFQSGWATAVVLILLNISVSIWLVMPRFKSVALFEQDLAIDEREKHKTIDAIFSMSMDIEKTPKLFSNRKSPLLFANSKSIFKRQTPKHGFLELFVKVVLRSNEYSLRYLQILGVTSTAVITLPPVWMKIGICIAGCLFLVSWADSVWHKVVASHPFTRKYAMEQGYFEGKKLVVKVLIVPYFVMILLSVGILGWIRNNFLFF